MNLTISSSSVEVTDSMKEKIEYGLRKISDIYRPITHSLSIDKDGPGFSVKIHYIDEHGNDVNASQTDTNFYHALTSAIDKAKVQLDRKNEKLRSHR